MVGWLRVSPRVSRTVQNQSKIVQLSLFIPPFCPFFGPPCIYPSFSRVPKRPLFSFFLFLMKQFVSRSGFSARSAKLVSPSRLPSWAPRRGSKGRAVEATTVLYTSLNPSPSRAVWDRQGPKHKDVHFRLFTS